MTTLLRYFPLLCFLAAIYSCQSSASKEQSEHAAANEAIITDWFAALNSDKWEEELKPFLENPDGFINMHKPFREAFPDYQATVNEFVTAENTVVSFITVKATHSGDFPYGVFNGVSPSGNTAEWNEVISFNIKDGMLDLGSSQFFLDEVSRMQQFSINCLTQEEAESTEVKVMETSDIDLSMLFYEGDLTTTRFWQDAKGENVALFTLDKDVANGEARLFVYHYIVNGNNRQLQQDARGSVTDCMDADLFLNFVDEAITITDLDQDNIGEISFAYRSACVTDVSPHSLILHLFEDGNDYSLRGNTQVAISADETIGGDISETRFEYAPASFLTHAQGIWENIKEF